jgi:hypothetical protein
MADEQTITGSWYRDSNGFDMVFRFANDGTLHFTMSNGTDGCVLDAKYKAADDGTLNCEVTKFEKMGGFPIEKPVGYTFSFKTARMGEKLELSAWKGKGLDEEAQEALNGLYERKK